MPGSTTAPGRAGARSSAPVRIAFRQPNGVGTRDDVDFAAQWLAYAIPYRRFAEVLADNCARLGADVVCYTFIAADLHHLLLAGLPAHSVPDPAKVGVCASGGQMSDAEKHIYIERLYSRQFPPENGLLAWRLHGQSVLEGLGLPASTDMFSRGVFVFSPRHHAAMLRDVYDGDRDSSLHEQPFISAQIGARGLAACRTGFAERGAMVAHARRFDVRQEQADEPPLGRPSRRTSASHSRPW